MYQAVIEAWHSYSTPLEGRVNSLYLDIKGLVTTGVGNLVDPVSLALELPWKRDADNQPATKDEIRAAWQLLKSHQEYAHRSTTAARALTKIHLDDEEIDALVARRLSDNQAFITKHHFPFFPDFPADAQLGIMSMAWAAGSDFPREFHRFKKAVLVGDWLAARDECTLREEGNAGVIPRNRANRVAFANAEIVTRCHLARDVLRWPNVAQADVPPSDRAANLGTLVVTALEDAREHAVAVALLEERRFADLNDNRKAGHHEMSEPEDDEITRVEGRGNA
jgi:GH24 family phage-related lysozyme (muramidase)